LVLAYGRLQQLKGPPSGRRAEIEFQGDRVSLSLFRDGQRESWVITGFTMQERKGKSGAGGAGGLNPPRPYTSQPPGKGDAAGAAPAEKVGTGAAAVKVTAPDRGGPGGADVPPGDGPAPQPLRPERRPGTAGDNLGGGGGGDKPETPDGIAAVAEPAQGAALARLAAEQPDMVVPTASGLAPLSDVIDAVKRAADLAAHFSTFTAIR